MKQYLYLLVGTLWGASVSADAFQSQSYDNIATSSNNWNTTLTHFSSSLKGLSTRKRELFQDIDHGVFALRRPFDSVTDLEFVELVLALANIAHRNKSDCSGEMSKLWKRHPEALLRAELARIMFYPTSEEHPLRGVASEVTRHRFIDTEWVRGNWWLVENITRTLYEQAPYAAKQITKRDCLLKQVTQTASQFSADQAASYQAHYDERSKGLPMQTTFAYYIPYQYVLDHEAELAQKIDGVHVVTIVADQPMLRFQTGSHQLVSHIGFLISDGTTLTIRHADSVSVCDTPLCEYLKTHTKKQSWNDKVLGIQVIRIKSYVEQGHC